MGGIELDLTAAVFPPGDVVIDCKAVMGGIEIVVPPDLDVRVDGFAVFGTFNDARRQIDPPRVGGPKVRITGTAFFGGVEVRVPRKPGLLKRLFHGD